jgi:signal transduction histidine kinase
MSVLENETRARVTVQQLLSRLAGRTAHDLNNVLAVLSGHLYLLRAEAEPPEEAFAAMEIAVEQLQTLAKSLAALGPLASGELLPVDVNEAVRAAAENRGSAGAVEQDLAAGLPRVPARREDLTQAVEALISNALEASGPGQPVRVATALDPEGAVGITVEDSGEGVPAEVRRRSFEPLFSTRGVKCRGVGITLATAVAAQSGGSLSIEERPGGGTRATLRLPVADSSSADQL